MSRARYLLRNINLINIMLTGVLIFLVNYMLLPFLNKSMQYSLPVIKKHEVLDSGSDKKPDQTKTPSPLDYAVIVEQNLFHPERKIPVEKKEAEKQPLPKPDFVLYGTLITEELTMAYIEDKKSPVSSPGRAKKQSALKLGQSMSGFILKEVEEDQVVMQRGEEKIVISINDAKTRESAAPAGTGTAAAAQTPGQPAQAVQQKPTSPAPGQQIRQEKRAAAATAREKARDKDPNEGPIIRRRLPVKKNNKPGGGGWFGID